MQRSELGCGDDRLVGDPDTVEGLVPILQSVEDLDRLVDGRLAHEDRLEAALERRVALDVRPILVERRRADDVKLTAGQGRLEHVRRVHGALGGPGPDHRMHLVDEEDQVLGGPHLVDHDLQPLLELAPVLCAGDHPGEVERDHAIVGKRLGHLVVDDPLGDAFDDRRLPDSRLAQERRVVLRPAGEDLDRLVDLVRAADHRVELPFAGLGRQVTAELVQLGCPRRFLRSAALDAADDGPRSFVWETPKRSSSSPASVSVSRANASSTCSGPT